jgi:hypothetical protein
LLIFPPVRLIGDIFYFHVAHPFRREIEKCFNLKNQMSILLTQD